MRINLTANERLTKLHRQIIGSNVRCCHVARLKEATCLGAFPFFHLLLSTVNSRFSFCIANMKIFTLSAILGLAALASAEVFLHETFSDGEGWKDRWTPSAHREDLGKVEVSPGKWFVDEEKNAGLRTTEDYRFYALSTPIKPFSNKGKDLVVQLDVKNDQNIDCGGSYVKVQRNEINKYATEAT